MLMPTPRAVDRRGSGHLYRVVSGGSGFPLRAVGCPGHAEGPFVKYEYGYGGTYAQREEYRSCGDTVLENLEQVVYGLVVVSAALQELDEREHLSLIHISEPTRH